MQFYFCGEPHEIPELTVEHLLNAPKVKRTHVYVLPPYKYDICCPICGASKAEDFYYSEYEYHYWCYKCEKDIIIPHRYAGIFGGPIPVQASAIFGIVFHRRNIETGEITECPQRVKDDLAQEMFDHLYNITWVDNEELNRYNYFLEKLFIELIDE